MQLSNWPAYLGALALGSSLMGSCTKVAPTNEKSTASRSESESEPELLHGESKDDRFPYDVRGVVGRKARKDAISSPEGRYGKQRWRARVKGETEKMVREQFKIWSTEPKGEEQPDWDDYPASYHWQYYRIWPAGDLGLHVAIDKVTERVFSVVRWDALKREPICDVTRRWALQVRWMQGAAHSNKELQSVRASLRIRGRRYPRMDEVAAWLAVKVAKKLLDSGKCHGVWDSQEEPFKSGPTPMPNPIQLASQQTRQSLYESRAKLLRHVENPATRWLQQTPSGWARYPFSPYVRHFLLDRVEAIQPTEDAVAWHDEQRTEDPREETNNPEFRHDDERMQRHIPANTLGREVKRRYQRLHRDELRQHRISAIEFYKIHPRPDSDEEYEEAPGHQTFLSPHLPKLPYYSSESEASGPE